MFTGIVEELGQVTAVESRQGATRLEVRGEAVLEGTAVGDSIAVNGVCLTVTELRGAGEFAVEAVPETLRRTNLGSLVAGAPVNLERAVSGGRFFGGHYVQGHVDGVLRVTRIEDEGEAKNYFFEVDEEWRKYIVPKGFVAIDGVSLTVVELQEHGFSVTLIPHTQGATVLGRSAEGYVANLEVDVLGKYVERIVGERLGELERRIGALES